MERDINKRDFVGKRQRGSMGRKNCFSFPLVETCGELVTHQIPALGRDYNVVITSNTRYEPSRLSNCFGTDGSVLDFGAGGPKIESPVRIFQVDLYLLIHILTPISPCSLIHCY